MYFKCVAALAGCFLTLSASAYAEGGVRADNSPEVTKWFQEKAIVTPESEKRLLSVSTQEEIDWMDKSTAPPTTGGARLSCCHSADRHRPFHYSVDNSGGDEWSYCDNEDRSFCDKNKTWKRIPNDVIHRDHDPTMPESLRRQGVLFINKHSGLVYCFWPPDGDF